jgi:hypothetical protein
MIQLIPSRSIYSLTFLQHPNVIAILQELLVTPIIKATATQPDAIPNILIQMKNDSKSDYTINFTRKALTYIANRTSLDQLEAVKALIASLETSDNYARAGPHRRARLAAHDRQRWLSSLQ